MKELLLTRDDKKFLNSVVRGLTSNGYQPSYSVQTEGLAEHRGILIRAFRNLRYRSEQKRINEMAWAERVFESLSTNNEVRQGDVDLFISDELTKNRNSIYLAGVRLIYGYSRVETTSAAHLEVAILEKGDPKDIYPKMIDKANLIIAKNRSSQ